MVARRACEPLLERSEVLGSDVAEILESVAKLVEVRPTLGPLWSMAGEVRGELGASGQKRMASDAG